jgi:hypothetical protein
MALQIAPLIALERRRPVPDGVLFAVGRMQQLMLAGNNGTALSYAPLSNFLASIAQLWVRKDIEPVERAQCLPNCKHEFSKGNSASIVLKVKGLTAACKDLRTAFVLPCVTPRHPCDSGKPFYDIGQKAEYNYMIINNKNKLQLINNFGSSRQAYPALQPHPC